MRQREMALFRVAESQQGLFTAKQAEAAGYASKGHAAQVKNGRWQRVDRGVYRLTLYPQTDRPDLVHWSLWSRGRDDDPQGVFSHRTALSLYHLSDDNPSKLDMTIPSTFRKQVATPPILRLHRATLDPTEVQVWDGFKVTTLVRTFADLLIDGSLEEELLQQAIEEALSQGLLLSRGQLLEHPLVKDDRRVRQIVEQVA
ncbi:MAG: type IV toxin-antitoxin system AbiEi family antitoxin domain-containing protein [Parachlamydiales bacterium]